MPGALSLSNNSTATIGLVSGNKNAATIIRGSVVADGDDTVHLDNVSLLGNSSFDTAAAQITGNGHLTSTRNTVFSAKDGLDLGGNASADVDGSLIQATQTGVFMFENSSANLKNISLTSEATGLYLRDNTVANISDATLNVSNNRQQVVPDVDATDDFTAIGMFFDGTPYYSANDAPAMTISGSNLSVNSIGASTGLLFLENTAPINVSIKDSFIYSRKYGVYFENVKAPTPVVNSAPANIDFSNVSLKSDDNALLYVATNSRANILVQNGSQFVAGNGTALDVESGGIADLTVKDSDITGDVVNNGGTANLTLGSGGRWTGAFTHLSSLTGQAGSQTILTGSSDVTGNVVNGGVIELGNAQPGNQLTVGGDYTGNNGTLLFKTALGADNSVTDRLVVNGSTAGSTGVIVTNAGGTGAKTLDGIELIHVNGSSDGEFKQAGRIVAGAYDYSLTQKGKNWYLDSYSPEPVPGPAKHVVRPEAGSYIANQAASSMFLTTLHDRAGENRYMNVLDGNGEATSLWLRQVGVHNRFRDGSGQLKITGNTYVAQIGGDLAQWSSSDHDRYHLGLMAGYGNNSNSTHSTVSGHGSKGSVDGYSVGMYGTWYQNDTDKTGAYVDGQMMYSWFNNHVNGDGISAESYKSKGVTASAETGYTFSLGQSGAQDNPVRYLIEPQAQVTWMGVRADDLTETNGTKISSRGDNNIQTRLGVRAFLQGHSRMDNGTDRSFQPFVEANWLHNTKRNGVDMNGVAVEQAGATNLGEIKLGVEGQLSRAVQLWGNVAQDVGSQGYSNTAAMIGVKYSF